MLRRRVLVLLVASCSLFTCQQNNLQVATEKDARTARPDAPAESHLPSPFDAVAVRTITESERLDYSIARLAVERVRSPGSKTAVRVDKSVVGESPWIKRTLQDAGISVSDQNDHWVLQSEAPGGLSAALRRSLGPIHTATDRCRLNLLSLDAAGHRARFGSLEQIILDAADHPSSDEERIDFSPGRITQTDNQLDVAIQGCGLFTFEIRDQNQLRRVYTRDGRLAIRADGALTARALPDSIVVPYLAIPQGAEDVGVTKDGVLRYRAAGEAAPHEAGRLGLAWFEHPERLTPIENEFFVRSAEAGALLQGLPGEKPFGTLATSSLERSNLNPAEGWLSLCRLEDARNLILAMLAELDGSPTAPDSSSLTAAPRVQEPPAVVTLPNPSTGFHEVEPSLLRFLRLRGVDVLMSKDLVEVPVSPGNAAALLDYLKFLKTALRIAEDNIAQATVGGQLQVRRVVRLTQSGAFEVVVDSRPSVINRTTPNTSTEIEIEKTEADAVVEQYRAVVAALQMMGKDAVPALSDVVRSGPCDLQTEAAKLLGRIGADAACAGPLLMDAINTEDWEFSREAATALQRISPRSTVVDRTLVRFWIAQLQGNDPRRTRYAAWALGGMGESASPAVPALARLLENPATGAARALGELGPTAAPAVPALAKSLAHPDAIVREQAADALGRIGPKARTAVAALVSCAGTDANSNVRWRAATAVARIGARDSGCLAALATLLIEQPPDVRDRVMAALDEFQDTRAELNKGLAAAGHGDMKGRGLAMVSLTSPSADSIHGISALAALLVESNAAVRVVACQALGQLGPLAAPTADILMDMTDDSDDRVAAAAIEALGRMGGNSSKVIANLSLALLSANPVIRERAARSLARFGPSAESAVPSLVDRLGDASESVVLSCVAALQEIGAQTPEAHEGLKLLEAHRSGEVRLAARTALETMSSRQTDASLHASKGDEEDSNPGSR